MSSRRAAAGGAPPAARRVVMAAAWTLGVLLPVALAGAANGAAPVAGDGPRSPRDCAAIADPAQRLACFDRFYPKSAPAPLAAPGTTTEATMAETTATKAAASGAADAEALFGLNADLRRARGETPPAERAPQQIESSLTGLASLGPGRLRLTLANGQVWDQIEAAPGFQPQPGDPITVRQAAMGSYLLRGRVGAPVRARRVR